MNKAKLLISLLLISFVAATGSGPNTFAQERELKTDNREKIDAVLLLDSSGSMLRTDPLRLREEGAKLFIQFLKPGDRLALIEFSDGATLLRGLSPYDNTKPEIVADEIAKSTPRGEYTDILAAIKLAAEILEKDSRDEANPIIVVLSDGKMEPNPALGSSSALTNELMNDYMPELKSKGIKVNTLAFSDDADKDLLSQMALATDGLHWFTPNSEKVHESFADLFLAVKKPQMLPLTAKGFNIDADIQEATFYINRDQSPQIKLEDPKGQIITSETKQENLRWFRGQKFDVVTITLPEVGNWKVIGVPSNDGFATVLTNLKLVSDWPGTVHAETEALIQARLYEADKPVALNELSSVTRFAFQITPTDKVSEPIVRDLLYDDATHGDKVAADGIFSFTVNLKEQGEYKLRVVASSPTFERNQQMPFRVKRPLIRLAIISAEEFATETETNAKGEGHAKDAHADKDAAPDEQAKEHGESKEEHNADEDATKKGNDYIKVELSEDAASFKKVQVTLLAVDLERKRFKLPIEQKGQNKLFYYASSATLPHLGEFELEGSLNAEDKAKKIIKVASQPLSYIKVEQHGEVEEHVVTVVEEHEPEPVIEEPFPLVAWIASLILGMLTGGSMVFMFKKQQGKVAYEAPKFEALEPALQKIAALEAQSALSEVDFNDPRFKDIGIGPLPAGEATAQSDKTAVAPSAPAGEEAAAKTSASDVGQDGQQGAEQVEPNSDTPEGEPASAEAGGEAQE